MDLTKISMQMLLEGLVIMNDIMSHKPKHRPLLQMFYDEISREVEDRNAPGRYDKGVKADDCKQ